MSFPKDDESPGLAIRRQLGLVAGAAVYSVSGTLLTLINKIAIQVFPYACFLILIQNVMTIMLLLVTTMCCTNTFGKLVRPTMATLVRWSPLSCLFVAMLLSSLMALKHISAVSFVVLRNLTTIVVAVGECYVLGARFSWPAVATLWGMLFGSAIYGASDLSFDAKGYAWLLANIIASSSYQVYVKTLARDDSMSPLDMAYISNVISVPVLALCSMLLREISGGESVARVITALVQPATLGVVFASGFFGYSLSTSAFLLNTLVSATTIMVINNANKFTVILLSEVFMERSLGMLSTAGTLIVLYFAYMYSKCPRLGKDAPTSGTAYSTVPADADAVSVGYKKPTILYVSVVLSGMLMTYAFAAKAQLPSYEAVKAIRQNNLKSLVPVNSAADAYAAFLPSGGAPAVEHRPGVVIVPPTRTYYEDASKECSTTAKSTFFHTCDGKCDASQQAGLPREIVHALPDALNISAINLVDHVLRAAWGRQPPSVDLYVRTGCAGLNEMIHLLPSIELFWPRFLGKVIIVLDYADQEVAPRFAPLNATHAYEIRFEHVPCMPARIFNQVSYLHADLHSDADYLVTIDSDCVLISPVTPDLLFSNGKLLLAYSQNFQHRLWEVSAERFVGEGTYDSHAMVVQPVSFHRTTFKAYREWFRDVKQECYTDAVVKSGKIAQFCWMCQLWTFMNHTRRTIDRYQPANIDSASSEPFQRMALHITYERYAKNSTYEEDSLRIVLQGLCHAFGADIFPGCADVQLEYFDNRAYTYAGYRFNVSKNAASEHSNMYTERIRAVYRQTIHSPVSSWFSDMCFFLKFGGWPC